VAWVAEVLFGSRSCSESIGELARAGGSDTARTAWGAGRLLWVLPPQPANGVPGSFVSSPCLPRLVSQLTGGLAVAAVRRSPGRRDHIDIGRSAFRLPSRGDGISFTVRPLAT